MSPVPSRTSAGADLDPTRVSTRGGVHRVVPQVAVGVDGDQSAASGQAPVASLRYLSARTKAGLAFVYLAGLEAATSRAYNTSRRLPCTTDSRCSSPAEIQACGYGAGSASSRTPLASHRGRYRALGGPCHP